jgi:hypothetical protein
MHHAALLYDPIQEIFGVPAMLTPNRQVAAGAAVTVVERTTSADASEEPSRRSCGISFRRLAVTWR